MPLWWSRSIRNGSMPPVNPLPLEPLPLEPVDASLSSTEPVSQQELNAWRRGFTPQAEIWNGRLARLGLSVGLGVLLLVRLAEG